MGAEYSIFNTKHVNFSFFSHIRLRYAAIFMALILLREVLKSI
jgi:hypothetical protein